MKITSIKGFADILPGEVEIWQFVEEKAREVFGLYNFSEIRIPIVERTELFSRSLGETTDIVEKEMYTFTDQDVKESRLTLRPEGTAGVVRAYVESEMYQVEPVRKLFYSGPMFRRERPQKGRQRQFYQIGAEVLGRGDALIDAELLLLLSDLFSRIGLEGVTLELNSLGCVQCRPAYREKLLAFLRERADRLCENCRRRMERNPLRALDCKEPSCIEATREAPSILDHLCAACRDHFDTVQSLLRQSSVVYKLNPRMVRGLDYYCRTTFEWTSDQLGAQNAVAAGGRYDGLVDDLGGPPTPGVGFAMGMERLVLLLSARELRQSPRPAVFLVWVGDAGRDWAFPAAHKLRRRGLSIEMEGEKKSLKSQMRRADKLRARYVVIVGDEELSKRVAVLRDMDSKEQSELKLDSYEDDLVKKVELRG
ncbi:MAG TPA: histidine--tRNA ligase [Verrucomicrobiae bacterium]|jgi:histidyl-tRNA synthetase|nr:histidine--tRNA ligase [Verrucomicrobiae bacterium]